MSLSKEVLREGLKQQRHDLGEVRAQTMSREIATRCIELIPWAEISSLHSYVPVLKEHEVDSWHVLEYVWRNYPNIQTSVPVRNGEDGYDSVAVDSQTAWQSDKRIPKPENGNVLPDQTRFDVIIVPMLGFDESGYRLGHGKGWYDRFLASQQSAMTIGLSYEASFVAQGLPHEAHDIPMQYIVTEQSVRKIV